MILPIDKNLIPYRIAINLGGFEYTITVNYNTEEDYFTLDLEAFGAPVIFGEVLNINEPLFYDFQYANVPPVILMPLATGEDVPRLGWAELNETVEIYLVNAGDVQ